MTGTIEKQGHWFCSTACIQRFEAGAGRRWFRNPTVWAAVLVGVPLAAGRFFPAAAPVAQVLWQYLVKSGWALGLGLVLGGLMDHYLSKEYISLWLTGHRRRMIIASAGLGFIASACSHGCLALSMELYRKGASVPAVITFLLASPWASFSLTLLILSLMGVKGLLIVVVALIVAITTGWIFQILERKGKLDRNPHTVSVKAGFSIWQDLKRRFRERQWTVPTLLADFKGVAQGTAALARMVLFWVALGFTLSAVFGTVVPHGWWNRFLGPGALGLLTTMGIATLFEVCSEGTAPLAVEIYKQTGALGNAFSFLMSGVVTDVTELSVVWANLGKKVVGWMLLITLPQVFFWGIWMNLLGR